MAAANIFESNAPQHGDRATEAAHRKIELQSPADLKYLIANVTRAAQEKIEKSFPAAAAPDGDDALRKKVEVLVDEYIRNTFNAAKDSMSINGMDSRELDAELAKAQEGEELEPFDSKLAQRIQNLSTQIENQTLRLANLRRKAPRESAEAFIQSWDRQTEEYDSRLQADEAAKLQTAQATDVRLGDTPRVDEMQTAFSRGTEGLAAVKTGLGGTVAKMERAQRAVSVLDER